MAPPLFADLGKSARDVFTKGYNFGFYKLDSTTRTGSGVEFKTAFSHNVTSNKAFGSLDIKYKIPKYGMTLTEKWNTDNTLVTEVAVDDQIVQGLKTVLDSSFSVPVGKRNIRLKNEYFHENVAVNGDITLDSAGSPLINGGLVLGYEGFLVGWHGGFDTGRSKLTHSNIGFGVAKGNYAVHTFVNNNTEFGGNVYHRPNPNLEVAANVGWRTGDNNPLFGLGAKYQIDRDTIVRAKISNNSQLGFALTHTLKPALKVTFSTLVNIHSFADGGHKFGIGLEYDAPAPSCH
jgi:voltage-dependent anion channel protein 2